MIEIHHLCRGSDTLICKLTNKCLHLNIMHINVFKYFTCGKIKKQKIIIILWWRYSNWDRDRGSLIPICRAFIQKVKKVI